MTGKLHVVGFGPGGKEHMTFKAAEVIQNADVVTGYTAWPGSSTSSQRRWVPT